VLRLVENVKIVNESSMLLMSVCFTLSIIRLIISNKRDLLHC